ncbi:uncharacterized protein FTOL_09834 [Fusarium torulosum]|uniref:Uncharacterized protein n=1 Tax=Fusarium torulosum TaxID=33205 RepID=A0AAE8SLY0_9HYPO|nr:uncharacterized protein FTOL_09834 [Fusarium torulosum]
MLHKTKLYHKKGAVVVPRL